MQVSLLQQDVVPVFAHVGIAVSSWTRNDVGVSSSFVHVLDFSKV